MKDYYKILGVGKNAVKKDIKKAYRKLARECHPDAKPGDKAAEERFKEISAAYEVLSDPKKRAEYDRQSEFAAAGGPGRGAPPGGSHDYFTSDAGGFGSIFEDIFQARPGRAEAVRGDDLAYTISLGFKEAFTGSTKKIKIHRRKQCSTCGGSGAKPGSTPTVCPTCGGRGAIAQNQGFFSLSRACPACGGEGTIVKDHCPQCGGAGTLPEEKTVTVNIPAGIDDGAKLKYRGLGQAGKKGAPAGDLYIIVQVQPHPLFKRKGSNIHLDLPLKFTEAALGAAIKVPTVDGSVKLKIPPGTQSGQVFRVKGKGAAKAKGLGAGDLLVKVQVEVPKTLSPAEHELMVRLAGESKDDPRVKIEAMAGAS